MMPATVDFWRQLDIISPTHMEGLELTMIGGGGIGSPTVLSLAKMGVPKIQVFDDDSVESHNLPVQLFRLGDLGLPKVEALTDIVSGFSGTEVVPRNERFDGSQPLRGVVISGVDTMAARQTIWESVRYRLHVPLYIEARMGGEVARIHAVDPRNPEQVAWYESTLVSDEEALELPCTARATFYTVLVVAGLITSLVKKHVRLEALPKELIVDLATMTFLVS